MRSTTITIVWPPYISINPSIIEGFFQLQTQSMVTHTHTHTLCISNESCFSHFSFSFWCDSICLHGKRANIFVTIKWSSLYCVSTSLYTYIYNKYTIVGPIIGRRGYTQKMFAICYCRRCFVVVYELWSKLKISHFKQMCIWFATKMKKTNSMRNK